MSELRSAVESLRSESLSSLPDARVEEDFAELQAACEALEGERLRRLAEIDRRRLFERDGHLSAASWLAARFQMGWGEARRMVAIARSLERMSRARRAFDGGAVSLAAVRMLAEAREAEPDAFDRAEHVLVEAASRHSIPDLRRALIHWRSVVESERMETCDADEVLRERRHLHASLTLGGMVRLDGDLDPQTGGTFMTALRAVLDVEARTAASVGVGEGVEPDGRTPGQRRADALGEICRGWLDRDDRPQVAGERPHLSVTVPLDALTAAESGGGAAAATGASGAVAGAAGAATAELEHAGPIGRTTLRTLSCDASVARVVLGPRSEPLDVGRRTQVVPPAMRRAVVARDRHCRFPGCDRPQSWCDAHHIVHWADGGETSLENLVLLCRRHHRLTHQRFSIETIENRRVFRRRDGSMLDDRAGRAPP
jgi:hypothetical protein